ncbi:DUF6089 family protein [Fluviicola taffensis]|uniref:DUF6089 domain-containing protein n=1 Tax=Fluviicola taffensis (strain DSM 16823 / NCIMB 13979 / RW262) TaxID=755732 RepID=F2IJ43_FLUTR|nr:DUF6089 family protein [Fluviicola taffensis]AEA43901.1 hypothetical protein Fluta_1914 [Fluviicola taffensis DSM 16823]
MQKGFLVLIIGILSSYSWGQKSHRHNALSLSEFGFMAGGSYYIGDLNQAHFKNTNIAGQLLYRYNINARLAYRANFTYGKIEGYDSQQRGDFFQNRNLSFQSDLFEFGTGIEVTYFPFEIGNKKYKGTAYLLAELSLTRINPKADYNGGLVELQPLGTEGQGTELADRKKYSRIQLGVPMAVGVRLSLSQNIALNIEYGIRFLFTDYLDDVGGYRYADPLLLAASNGPTSAALGNRSLDANRFAQRGNRATRDWYTFFGIGLMFRLGGKGSCPQPR